MDVRIWDDEAVEAAAQAEMDGPASAELARRSEIKLNRMADAAYGSNRYGFTMETIAAYHDASWYESRQNEDEFLAEMGVAS